MTVDGPQLQLQAAHLFDLVPEVLNDDIQLSSLLLEVGELVTGRSGDSLVGGFQTFRDISKKSLQMQKFLVVSGYFSSCSSRVCFRPDCHLRRGRSAGGGGIT